jgi:branched-chain amino acid transport system permease protein
VGAIVGLPSLRIKGLYLAMATLASQFLIVFVISHWSLLGGGRGLAVEPAALGTLLRFDNDRKVYYLIVGCAFVLAMFAWNLFRTRIGRAFIAVRDRDYSAEVLGVNLLRYKLLAFALSSFYAGVAGALMAYFFRFIGPEHFGFSVSVFFLAAIIIGGLGSVLGAILGTVFMTVVPELLKELVGLLGPYYPVQAQIVLAPAREFVFGLLIVLFLLFEPNGIVQMWRRLRETTRTWPFRR